MLKNVHPLLTPELLATLAAMGHGDVLAIVDRNFPATSLGARVIPLAGASLDDATRAILTVFPVDTFVEPPAWRMSASEAEEPFEVHGAINALLDDAEERSIQLAPLERFEFYRRAADAFAIVTTTDDRPYGCFLLTKGVV